MLLRIFWSCPELDEEGKPRRRDWRRVEAKGERNASGSSVDENEFGKIETHNDLGSESRRARKDESVNSILDKLIQTEKRGESGVRTRSS